MASLLPNLSSRWPLFAAALWWGSMTLLGALVVPLLFAHVPTAAMAGQMAARLFTAQTWVGVVCGALLLLASRDETQDAHACGLRSATGWILAGMVLALLMEFAVAPRIVARENLRLWHSLGSGFYALQWLCAGVTLWKVGNLRSGSVS